MLFRKLATITQLLIQFPFRCILQDQVDPLFVVKIPVQPQNVWVAQVRLNFDFAP